jgi:mono/diheme cytochrome c family protein
MQRLNSITDRLEYKYSWRRLSAGLCSSVIVIVQILYCQNSAYADGNRGQYIVEALAACDSCHTPKSPNGYDIARRFTGGSQSFSAGDCLVRGGNITSDKDKGVGAWPDEALGASITHGIRQGSHLSSAMPYTSYNILSINDINDIVDYFKKTLPSKAGENEILEQQSRCNNRGASDPPDEITNIMPSGEQKKGFYIASVARCIACHSGETDGKSDYKNKLMLGGKVFNLPTGKVVAKNITNDSVSGIGTWSDEQIKAAIQKGVATDGHLLGQPMLNLSRNHFSKMSQVDLESLVLWLRTVTGK